MKHKGWNVPYDTTPDTWMSYIPENERASISNLKGIDFTSTPFYQPKVNWFIIQYGKPLEVFPYYITPNLDPMYQDIEALIPVMLLNPLHFVPVVIGGGSSRGQRSDFRKEGRITYTDFEVYGHAGIGVDIGNGVFQFQLGLQTGLQGQGDFDVTRRYRTILGNRSKRK